MAAVTSFIQNIAAPLLKNKKPANTKSSRRKSTKYSQRRIPVHRIEDDDEAFVEAQEDLQLISPSLSECHFKYNWSIKSFKNKVSKN